ncbi:hypothetical protein CMEL01_02211, partial [Colletotrichum melonis]
LDSSWSLLGWLAEGVSTTNEPRSTHLQHIPHKQRLEPRGPKWAVCRGGDLVSWHQVSVQYLPRRDSSVAASHFLLSGASLVPRRRKKISNQVGRVAERLEATGNGSRQRAEEAEHAESPATQPDAALVYGYMNGDLITYGFRLVEAKLLVLGMRLSVQPAKYPYTLSPDINEAPAALTNGPHQQMAYNLCASGSCSLYLNKVFDGPQAPVGTSPERQTKKD